MQTQAVSLRAASETRAQVQLVARHLTPWERPSVLLEGVCLTRTGPATRTK